MFVNLSRMSLRDVCAHYFFQVDSGFSFRCLNITSTTDYSKVTLSIPNDSLQWNSEPSKLSLWSSEHVKLGWVIRSL